jgi:anti-sigma28 factor (negative regulator of flagellin synthesis)
MARRGLDHAMRIDDSFGAGLPSVPPADNTPAATRAEGLQETRETSDRADLSSAAGRAAAILRSDDAARVDRIQALKQAVASGAYQADTTAVGRGIVEESILVSGDERPGIN